jgi:hypothetical protein
MCSIDRERDGQGEECLRHGLSRRWKARIMP